MRLASALFLLLIAYAMTFALVTDYEVSWMHPEAVIIHQRLGALDISDVASVIKHTFNYPVLEWAPRIGRPISSFFQIIDWKLRQFLWNSFLPHPSLSLSYAFVLAGCPLFLFFTLRRLGVAPPFVFLSLALFLSNPAILSLVVMFFRPAKALATFSMIAVLFLCARANASRTRSAYLLVLLGLLTSQFCDEITSLLFLAVPLLFPALLHGRFNKLLFLTAGLSVGVFYLFLIPALIDLAGFPPTSALSYAPLKNNLSQMGSIVLKSRLLAGESLGLFFPGLATQSAGRLLLVANWMAFFVLLGRGFLVLYRENWSWKRLDMLQRTGLFLVPVLLFHSGLIGSVGMRSWGAYWYGTYWPVFSVLFLALLFGRINQYWMTFSASFLIVLSNFYVFPFTNYSYKKHHYYPHSPAALHEMFENDRNRFSEPVVLLGSLEDKTDQFSRHARGELSGRLVLPNELIYLIAEMRWPRTKALTSYVPAAENESYYIQVQ